MRGFVCALIVAIAGVVGLGAQGAPPKALYFSYTDAELATVSGFQVDIYQCLTVTTDGGGQVCASRGATPRQSVFVPVAAVATFTTDANGDNRSIDLTAPPLAGVVAALPPALPFAFLLSAVGVPNTPVVGVSSAAGPTGPFYIAPAVTPSPAPTPSPIPTRAPAAPRLLRAR